RSLAEGRALAGNRQAPGYRCDRAPHRYAAAGDAPSRAPDLLALRAAAWFQRSAVDPAYRHRSLVLVSATGDYAHSGGAGENSAVGGYAGSVACGQAHGVFRYSAGGC